MRDTKNKSLRILLVEDEAANAFLFREFIVLAPGLADAHVEVVDSLAAALACVAEEPFDLVFLDLGLPDSYGIPTLESFREAAPDVPVVVLSNSVEPEVESEILAKGATAFLRKTDSFPGALARVVCDALPNLC